MHIYSLYPSVVQLCPPDSTYCISRRQGEYSSENTMKQQEKQEHGDEQMEQDDDGNK